MPFEPKQPNAAYAAHRKCHFRYSSELTGILARPGYGQWNAGTRQHPALRDSFKPTENRMAPPYDGIEKRPLPIHYLLGRARNSSPPELASVLSALVYQPFPASSVTLNKGFASRQSD